jgi:hypothetical protein
MKYGKLIGILACIVLIIACFMPWTYHADINKTFTGFFSENNAYGRPGKFFVFFALASLILILLPKVWAKRAHLILSALCLGFAIKTFILFTSCYNAYCPEKKYGIFLVVISCIIILIVAIFPSMKVEKEPSSF